MNVLKREVVMYLISINKRFALYRLIQVTNVESIASWSQYIRRVKINF